MSFRLRPARPSDFRDAFSLLEPDRPLFSAALWRALPSILADLLAAERIRVCAFENMVTGAVAFLGGSAFLNPRVRDAALHQQASSLMAVLFRVHGEGGYPFLNRRQVAEGNRRGDLCLLNMFGSPHGLVDAGGTMQEAATKATAAWRFFHDGFDLGTILLETANATQAAFFRNMPAELVWQRTSVTGQRMWLFRIDRGKLGRMPLNPFVSMTRTAPRFHFSPSQQRVLELALLDFSDREIVAALDVTEDSLKKRWRSVYQRVKRIEPAVLDGRSGTDARRALLQRLRQNLVELRPFR
jgi:hypothetical protein